jgi:hypothetical protein
MRRGKININKQFYKDTMGWGFILWLFGYALGIMLFEVVPIAMIGWIILPVGTIITTWVLYKKIRSEAILYYLLLAIVWALIAIVFDYFFLVKAFKPADGYYKLDVYLYYTLTFILPLIVGWRKQYKKQSL